jgi:hypothetical protein
MKTNIRLFRKYLVALSVLSLIVNAVTGQLYEWRGPGRTGIYNETGLLKKWPDGGPKLLWVSEGMGYGFSSPTVTDDAIFVTGRKETNDVLVALANPNPEKLDIVSEFQITKGEGPFWPHPVIKNGKLYIRHGDWLMVYQVK